MFPRISFPLNMHQLDYGSYLLSVSFSIMVNDILSGLIIPSRGIHQDDLLSLYSFIICMEVLIQSLIREATTHRWGIRVKICPQATTISCLLFADNCLCFCKAQQRSYTQLKNVLESFYSYSDLLEKCL